MNLRRMKLMPFLVVLFAMAVMACSGSTVTEAVDEGGVNAETGAEGEYYQGIPVRPAEPTFVLTEEEWRERLTEEQFYILREHGTEPAFSGELLNNDGQGIYHCAGCDHPLFASSTKYDSRTGWPSYWEPLNEASVGTAYDNSLGQVRVEVHCGRCAGHLGHVFPDGPEPTGHRYCMNSAAMTFVESE